MIKDTEGLIRRLAQNVEPVRPLPNPWIRTAVWLGVSVPYLVVVMIIMTPQQHLSAMVSDPRFVIEQISALSAGLAAAVAAFATIIPGYRRRLLLVPLLPFVVWFTSLGQGCLQDLARHGVQASLLPHDPLCFLFIVLFGAVPGIAMVVMLRRGAPLTPRLTAAIAGLAAAGIGNFALRLVHPEDVSVMMLVWHVGGVFILSVLAGGAGHYVLNWRLLTAPSRNSAQ